MKVVCCLKFFYLAEDKHPFFTHRYANGKDIIFCESENSDVDNDHCDSCFGKYSHDGNEEWTKFLMSAVVPALCQLRFLFFVTFKYLKFSSI